MDEQARKEFQDAITPLHDWLCKYGHPHMVVIVQQDGAQAYSGVVTKSLPVPD